MCGLLFYFNVVEPLCFGDLFCFKQPFYSMNLFNSMDCGVLCFVLVFFSIVNVLILQ